jgi:hypothetical protein
MLTCFIVGLGTKRRFWVTTVVWPLMVAMVLGLTADLDSPRTGLIQISRQSLQRLQENLTAVAATNESNLECHPLIRLSIETAPRISPGCNLLFWRVRCTLN